MVNSKFAIIFLLKHKNVDEKRKQNIYKLSLTHVIKLL